LKSVLVRLFVKPDRAAMIEFLNKRSGCTHREDYRLHINPNGNTLVLLNQESKNAMALMHREGDMAQVWPMAYDSVLHAFMKRFRFAAIKHDKHTGSWFCIMEGNDVHERSILDRPRK